MIAPDANLLIYAYNRMATLQHAAAKRWLEGVLSGGEPVGIPMLVVAAFLRVISDTRWEGCGMPVGEALATVESWLARPHVTLLHAGDQHWTLLSHIAREAGVSGSLLTDAQIGAVALEYDATVYTSDRDFARFPSVRSVRLTLASQ